MHHTVPVLDAPAREGQSSDPEALGAVPPQPRL